MNDSTLNTIFMSLSEDDKRKILITFLNRNEEKEEKQSIQDQYISITSKSDRPVKAISVKGYFDKLHTLHTRMHDKKPWGGHSLEWLSDVKTVHKFICDNWNNRTTQWAYINSITSVLRRFPEYKKAYDEYAVLNTAGMSAYQVKRANNEATVKQRKNIMSWSDIQKVEFKGTPTEEFLFELMRDTPRRCGSIVNLKYLDDDNTEDNYLIEDDDGLHMVLNKYKTDKCYGMVEYTLKDDTEDKFLALKKSKNFVSGDYIFPKTDGLCCTTSAMTARIKKMSMKALGKPMTTRAYRISRASHVANDSNMSNADREVVAMELGHSLSTLMQYRLIGV